MTKNALLKKATVYSLVICMSTILFAGCQNDTSKAASSNTKNISQSGARPSSSQMEQRVQDSVKSLVTAGTITQAQADKITTAYTTHPNGNKNKTQNNQQGGTQNKQRFNPLSKLVSDGTITQAQADAVTQKLRGNFQHRNNGPSSN
ncbi:hypothetical protein [Clostridium ljungdahlii]|uniref:Lipoprotein n=1 Tax=Clostridium ljungdahlii (strain ATCC 55383 / DSM 13528 / PETC) TaxID=748727 RepID=D8GTK5_CLOLD|nr:hypothetical protein [Clostridium ljungdahlii]ADK14654.1 hypothetical protein CLJU_c15900 [Clostridium ljungdahlii DSM 13528]OAA85892.1 hypothetical protein WX45_00097 [Clostridium ljungdahlii DSM 13528]